MTKVEETLRSQYKILGHSGRGLTEIRLFDQGKRFFCRNEDEFVQEAMKHLQSNSYVGLNPRGKESGYDKDVSYLTCLCVDIDPIRPRGEPSTESQWHESLSIGEKISKDFPGAIRVSSGSGCHVYFPISPIEVENFEALKDSTKAWLDGIKAKYSTPTHKIDPIFDLSRIIRIWGSFNSKSKRVCNPMAEPSLSFRFPLKFSQTGPVPSSFVAQKSETTPALDTELQDRFQRLCLSNPIMHRLMNGGYDESKRSEWHFAFISCLVRAHFQPKDILTLFTAHSHGKTEERNESWFKQEVDRVIKKITKDGLETVSMAYNRDTYFNGLKDRHMGLLTGLPQFDEMVSGLKPTKVIVFAARPTEGKTTLATQILTNVALQGKTCLFFPTEVGSEPIYDKIISRKTGVSLKKFQNGAFTTPELERIGQERSYLANIPLVVCDGFALRVAKIEQKINEVAPQVVAIDYIQAMDYS
ncbi:MAG TPA: DnaB-like helicase C-terminal domain-containing protein, partial [Candidatus Hypogeohydataceae bacterium YC40]